MSCNKTMHFIKQADRLHLENWDKYASKDGIGLAIHRAFREVLIEVLSFRFGLAVLVLGLLLAVLLVDGFSLGHFVIYCAHK
jgi:hypothetical protein